MPVPRGLALPVVTFLRGSHEPEAVVGVRLTIAATNRRIDLDTSIRPRNTATLHVGPTACVGRKIAYLAVGARRSDESSAYRRLGGDGRCFRLGATSQERTG